ncbi:hypothetical protein GCM10027440_37350 [Nocardiopsis coralliicola]
MQSARAGAAGHDTATTGGGALRPERGPEARGADVYDGAVRSPEDIRPTNGQERPP